MLRITLSRIKHRKFTSFFVILAFMFIFLLIPFGIHQSHESKAILNETIEKEGRGTYDLLVRTKDGRSDTEKQLGVVEENYLVDGQGGISIEEWKHIQANPDIELAAPVASIGYFTGMTKSIEIIPSNESTKYTAQFYTSDGIKEYPLGAKSHIVTLEDDNFDGIQVIANGLGQVTSRDIFFLIPSNYHLLVGIDPESEQKLTGIDFQDLEKEIQGQRLEDLNRTFNNAPIVKVMQRADLDVPLKMVLKEERVNVTVEKYLEILNLDRHQWILEGAEHPSFPDIEQELFTMNGTNEKVEEFDLTPFLNPFEGSPLILTKDGGISTSQSYIWDQSSTSVYYTTSSLNYENLSSTPTLSIVTDGSPPAYKKVEEKGVSRQFSEEVPFVVEQVGKFFSSEKPSESLVSSPLGIYGTTPVETTDGTILTPTTVPGSFIAAAAGGVTTLESAQLIKGEKPIDAIRIRVAGITSYNEEARGKIERVATKLLEQGYEVDIVAGASFKKDEVQVEGISNVIIPWTTLGTALELLSSWDSLTLLISGLFLILGLSWISSRIIFEKYALKNENLLLAEIGWQWSQIRFRNNLEQLLLITSGFVLSLFLLVFIQIPINYYSISLLLWLIAIGIIFLFANKKKRSSNKNKRYKKWHSIQYYKSLLLPTIVVFVISTSIMSLLITNLGETWETASVTTMGLFISEKTIGVQLLILTASFIISIFSIFETGVALLTVRKDEFLLYHSIGWSHKRVIKHFFKEVFQWTSFAIFSGLVLSCIVMGVIGNFGSKWTICSLITSFFISGSIIFVTMYFQITNYLKKSI